MPDDKARYARYGKKGQVFQSHIYTNANKKNQEYQTDASGRVCTANPDFFSDVSVTQIMIDPARVFQAQEVQSPWNFALP